MNKIYNLNKLNKNTKYGITTILLVVAAFLVMQSLLLTQNASYLLEGMMIPVCYYIILAISLNLTVGILGELSLGHAGFMCIGAFSGAFFSKTFEDIITEPLIRFPLAIIVGAFFAGIFGIIISLAVTRLQGDYLAIVTLAFGEIIKNVINLMYAGVDKNGIHFSFKNVADLNLLDDGKVIIQGARGITRTPQDASFLAGFILVVVALFIVLNFVNSRTGRAVMAVRDNKIAAQSVGINIKKYRILAFSVSAALAGVAGVLYSHNIATLSASPKNFGYNMSISILVIVVLGGIGKIRGSLIAAVVLTILPEYLRFLQDYRMLIYAVILIAYMLLTYHPKLKNIFLKKEKKEMEA